MEVDQNVAEEEGITVYRFTRDMDNHRGETYRMYYKLNTFIL